MNDTILTKKINQYKLVFQLVLIKNSFVEEIVLLGAN